MQTVNYKRTKFACYSAYFTMSSVFCLPPLLFVTFHESYGISWTLLGTLVLVNFITQLGIDLIFTFFSRKFNPKIIVRVMPIITATGLFLFALSPVMFQGHEFWGMLLGTVVFSVAAGLSEVLLSPTIAAIPSKNPQGDMSLLHSIYGIGVFTIIIISALFLKFIGEQYWMYLTMGLACLPVLTSILFLFSPMPDMPVGESGEKGLKSKKKAVGIFLCVLCIFFGASAEVTMTNWVSSFMETEFDIDKAVGDVVGMAGFAIVLAITRIVYAKWGKNIWKTLLVGMIGAVVCYLIAGLVSNGIVVFIACVLTGIFTSMLWPGTLIFMEENMPALGVAAYALMAAGGDMGAAAAPQLMGIVADFAGFKVGMVVSAIFPVLGIVVLMIMRSFFKKPDSAPLTNQNLGL